MRDWGHSGSGRSEADLPTEIDTPATAASSSYLDASDVLTSHKRPFKVVMEKVVIRGVMENKWRIKDGGADASTGNRREQYGRGDWLESPTTGGSVGVDNGGGPSHSLPFQL